VAERVFVALGSNLGDRARHLAGALAGLAESPGVSLTRASSLYETAPVGPPGQGPYLNAVAELRADCSARALLERLLALEARAGRRRSGVPNEARCLDLDLLLYGARCLREPDLCVPHPRLHERAFVLEPLCELAPSLRHPLLGVRMAVLARARRDPFAVRRLGPAPLPASPL